MHQQHQGTKYMNAQTDADGPATQLDRCLDVTQGTCVGLQKGTGHMQCRLDHAFEPLIKNFDSGKIEGNTYK